MNNANGWRFFFLSLRTPRNDYIMQPKKKDNPKSLKVQQSWKQLKTKRARTKTGKMFLIRTHLCRLFIAKDNKNDAKTGSLANYLASFFLNFSTLHGNYF